VRSCIFSWRRCHAFFPPRGKNRALLPDLALELFLETAAHPFAAFHLDLQFHVAQPAGRAGFRVHLLPFSLGFLSLGRGTDFPARIMVRVSNRAHLAR
jgi:hypothetical protein